MTRLSGLRCNQCKRETYDYQPHGWNSVRLSVTPMRARQLEVDEKADLCSQPCLLAWLSNRYNELSNE